MDKRKWTEEIAKEAENAAEQQHMKNTVYPEQSIKQRKTKAECCKTGKILNDKESKLRRWLEHFSEVLNRENLVIQ